MYPGCHRFDWRLVVLHLSPKTMSIRLAWYFWQILGCKRMCLSNHYPEGSGLFNATPWAKEWWIPAHTMSLSFFSTLCFDQFVDIVPTTDWSSFFACFCDWALLIAHSSWGIFSFCLQSGDLCPALPHQYHFPSSLANESVGDSLFFNSPSSCCLFCCGFGFWCFAILLCQNCDYLTHCLPPWWNSSI